MFVFAAVAVFAAQAIHSTEFSFVSSTAKVVQIAGDFNAWSAPIAMTKTGGRWSKSFDLPDNGRIEYKFVADGRWIVDPANPHHNDNGVGSENSVWEGPRYRSTPLDSTPHDPPVRWEFTVGGRKIVVFSVPTSANLPILVLADGPTYESAGHVQNVVANLLAAHRIRPVMVVLIPPIDRLKEYGPDWQAYGHYVFDDVLPAIRMATGASSRPTDLYMGGSSMGGLIALRLAEEYPDQLAGGILCESPAIQWTAMNLHNEEVVRPEKLRQIAPTSRIWLDWGDFEDALTRANLELAARLKTIGRPFGALTTPEGHTWTAWRNRMPTGLDYILRP